MGRDITDREKVKSFTYFTVIYTLPKEI